MRRTTPPRGSSAFDPAQISFQELGRMVGQYGPLPPAIAVPFVQRVVRAMSSVRASEEVSVGRNQVFWLGAVLFFALTGQAPLKIEEGPGSGRRLPEAAPRPSSLSPHDIPEALDAVVRTCLSSCPTERFSSVMELQVALAALPYDEVVAEALGAHGWAPESGSRITPAPSSGVVRTTREAA